MIKRSIWLVLLLLPLVVQSVELAGSATESTRVESSLTETQRIEQLANRWEVTPQEWTRYETIMQGEGRYHWQDVDPIMVLGIYARNETERDRYALIMANREYRRQSQFLAFNTAYLKAFDTLYGDQPIIDLDQFYTQYQSAGMASSIVEQDQRVASLTGNGNGDRYVLFLNTRCRRCDDWYRRLKLNQLTGTALDLYFIGDTQATIGQWAQKLGVDPRDLNTDSLTLNLDNGMYSQYGRPALPAAYYFDVSEQSVQPIRDERGLP